MVRMNPSIPLHLDIVNARLPGKLEDSILKGLSLDSLTRSNCGLPRSIRKLTYGGGDTEPDLKGERTREKEVIT